MQSHCLYHQGRPASKRCVSCLKPLCEECCQPYPGGVYCGESCYQAAEQAQKRAAKLAESEKELREWRQRRLAFRMIAASVALAFLFFGWEFFPEALTDKVEGLWETVRDSAGW